MSKRIIDNHPHLKDPKERLVKMTSALVYSFEIEGIFFSQEQIEEMVVVVEEDIKKQAQ